MLIHLHRRLLLAGTLVVLAWVVWLATLTALDATVLRERENAVRGQIVAEALAQSVGRALGYGIALDELRGVEAVFAARIADNPAVREIVFDDLAGRAHFVQHPPRRVGVAVLAAVRSGDAVFGRVTVYLAPTAWLAVWSEPLSYAVLLMLVVWMSAREGLSYAIGRGPGLREAATSGLVAQVLQLDFSRVTKSRRSHRLDMRLAGLSGQLRELNERFTRLFHLITSLRQTEPNGDEQSRLLALAVQARGATRFADGKPGVQRLDSVRSDARWLVLGAVLSVALAAFTPDLGADPAGTAMRLACVLVAAWVGHALERYGLATRAAAVVGWAGWLVLLLAPLAGGLLMVVCWPGGVLSGGVRLAMVGMQGLGLGLFLSALGRFIAGPVQAQLPDADADAPSLTCVVVSALGVVGAALALLLGDVLGQGGLLLLSAGLAGCVGFFFALSSAGVSDALGPPPWPLQRPQGHRRWSGHRPAAVVVMNTALGLALGAVLGAVTGGSAALLAWGTSTPGVGGWVVVLGLGLTAHHLSGQWPWRVSRVLAQTTLTACLAVLAGAWMGGAMVVWVAPAMYLALACTSYHVMGVLKTLKGSALSVAGLSAGALLAWLLPVAGALSGLPAVATGLWLLACMACGLLKPVTQPVQEASHAA